MGASNMHTIQEKKALYRTTSSPAARNIRTTPTPPTSLLVDVVETKDSYMIYADLPGMKKSEIKLTVKDRTVSLSAKRQSTGGDGRVYHRRERHQGTVSRSLLLPANADADKITAKYDAGVLEISITKAKTSPTRISPSNSVLTSSIRILTTLLILYSEYSNRS